MKDLVREEMNQLKEKEVMFECIVDYLSKIKTDVDH